MIPQGARGELFVRIGLMNELAIHGDVAKENAPRIFTQRVTLFQQGARQCSFARFGEFFLTPCGGNDVMLVILFQDGGDLRKVSFAKQTLKAGGGVLGGDEMSELIKKLMARGVIHIALTPQLTRPTRHSACVALSNQSLQKARVGGKGDGGIGIKPINHFLGGGGFRQLQLGGNEKRFSVRKIAALFNEMTQQIELSLVFVAMAHKSPPSDIIGQQLKSQHIGFFLGERAVAVGEGGQDAFERCLIHAAHGDTIFGGEAIECGLGFGRAFNGQGQNRATDGIRRPKEQK